MSCLSVTLSRVGGMNASIKRGVGGMNVRLGLVCGTSLGEYDVLWVKDDAALATINGEYLLVKRKQ